MYSYQDAEGIQKIRIRNRDIGNQAKFVHFGKALKIIITC
jgi:hypothetical protein